MSRSTHRQPVPLGAHAWLRTVTVLVIGAFFSTESLGDIPITLNLGEGYDDTTAFTNSNLPGVTTLGGARTEVTRAAAAYVQSLFNPNYAGETWKVKSIFKLDNDATSLGGGSVSSFVDGEDIPGAAINLSYPSTLANHLANKVVVAGDTVDAEFNTIASWDYSLTESPAAGGPSSMFTTIGHEIVHGSGAFNGNMTETTGAYPANEDPSIFDDFLVVQEGGTFLKIIDKATDAERLTAITSDALFFTGSTTKNVNNGQNLKMYAPATVEEVR